MMNRRRFIMVSATALLAPTVRAGTPVRWQGRAMGAEVSLVLHGGDQGDLDAALSEIRRLEARFSIYDPMSELSQINANSGGALSKPMSELLRICATVHDTTAGLFDPTVQPVFRAFLDGRDPPWHLVGWSRLRFEKDRLKMDHGQAITLNGIAQGYATDRVRRILVERGFTNALVSVGEQAAIGGPFRLSLEDPVFGPMGTRTLTDRAIATSSPGAMHLGNGTHILHPKGTQQPRWSTVSIEADCAALADGLSTALCHASLEQIEQTLSKTHARATLVDTEGDVATIG